MQLKSALLSPSASWRDNTSLAAADRLISRQKPLVAGLLTELNKGANWANELSKVFKKLAENAQRYAAVWLWLRYL
jgi:hypothetical protein